MLSKVASIAPELKENTTCLPEDLPPHDQVFCVDQGLTGKLLEKPRKVFVVCYMSFEIDVLEIVLREQADVVEKFFIGFN